MNDRILVTGANGQLGTELQKLLPKAIFADVDILDITDLDGVKKFVNDNQIDTIVNCAAYTAVDFVFSAFKVSAKSNGICTFSEFKTVFCKLLFAVVKKWYVVGLLDNLSVWLKQLFV